MVTNEMNDKPDIVFLTDSHGLYMARALKNDLMIQFKIKVKRMNGATVSGLKNTNSFTAASKDYEIFLDKMIPKKTIIFMQLGEVDCGILLWMKAKKNNSNIFEECDKTVNEYIDYVAKLNNIGFKKVVLTSATLPTIKDNDDIGEIKSLRRKQVQATYRERTDLTFYFNNKLKEECEKKVIDFIDLTDGFLDQKKQLCNEKFRNRNPEDHHMEYDEASIVWAKYIKEYLYEKHPFNFSCVSNIVLKDTYVKKIKKKSKYIPEKVLALKAGDNLRYSLIGETGNYFYVENLYINEKRIDNDFIFILKRHLQSA